MRHIHLVRYLILIVVIAVVAASASAQDMMQGQPQLGPVPRPTRVPPARPSNPEMQIPQQMPQQQWTPAPTPVPQPPPAIRVPLMAPQPVLPPVFRGCWQGTVESVQWMRRAPGGHKLGYWTPKTYRLCYKQIGNGPYQLTFGETGIVATEKIKYSKGRVDIVSTDGRSYAEMRAFLHFDEYHEGANYGGATFSVDEVTMLECKIDGDQMHVIADVDGRREDLSWFQAHWLTTFIRVPM